MSQLGTQQPYALLLGQLAFLSGTAQEVVHPLIPTFVVVGLPSSTTLLASSRACSHAGW